jgi:hypothetical protein
LLPLLFEVGLLAEHAFGHQGLAVGAGRTVQHDADPQAGAAHLLDALGLELLEAVHEVLALLQGVLHQLLLDDDLQSLVRDGAAQGVAAEGRAVVAGVEHVHDFVVGQERADGIEAAAQRLADDQAVGADAFPLVGEHLAGAAQAALDLVADQQHVVLLAEGRGLLEEALGRNDDAGLALNGLDDEGAGVRRDGRFESLGVAEGDDLEARGEGAEAVLVLVLGREAHDGRGAAVEVVGADDDLGLVLLDALDLVAPLTRALDGGLDGFGAGVHGQDLVVAGQLGDGLVEPGQLVVAEGAAGQGDLGGLAPEHLQQTGVAVTLVDGAVRSQAVHVAVAFHVFYPDVFGLLDHQVEGMIVVGTELILHLDEFLSLLHGVTSRSLWVGCCGASRTRVCPAVP